VAGALLGPGPGGLAPVLWGCSCPLGRGVLMCVRGQMNLGETHITTQAQFMQRCIQKTTGANSGRCGECPSPEAQPSA
jgi:hypothetical protein